jgi:hypothetical protein
METMTEITKLKYHLGMQGQWISVDSDKQKKNWLALGQLMIKT